MVAATRQIQRAVGGAFYSVAHPMALRSSTVASGPETVALVHHNVFAKTSECSTTSGPQPLGEDCEVDLGSESYFLKLRSGSLVVASQLFILIRFRNDA
jgi:hypothetical protein